MEFFVKDMKNLPSVIERRLSELRQLDSESLKITKAAAAEEAELFDEISTLAKIDPDFDEEPIKKRFEALISRRQEAQASVDEQMRKIQRLYDLVDGRITYIDSCTKEIAHLFPQGAIERGGSIRKKKRKKTSMDDALAQSVEDAILDGALAYDPNEPVYCTCRQISFGQMIACENPDCSIEWFHFGCVGLKAEPNEPWYCGQCKDDGF